MDSPIEHLTPAADGWCDATALDLSDLTVTEESISKVRFGDTLSGARFEGAELTEVEIRGRTIENVEFVNCRFKNCVMSSTWFSGCTFKHSTFDRCTFTSSVFLECDLYRVVFVSNNLMENTCFRRVSISQATLGGTLGLRRTAFDPRATPMTENPSDTQPDGAPTQVTQVAATWRAEDPQARSELPRTSLIQEDRALYEAFLQPIQDKKLAVAVSMAKRLSEAAEVWRCLSALWSSQGFAADAGWAYVRARRKERSDAALKQSAGMGLWKRALSAFRWLILLMADALCAFGNNLLLPVVVWLPALVAGTGVIFWRTGSVHTATGSASLSRSMLFSVTQMVNVSPGGLRAVGSAAHVIAAAEVFLGVALLGLIGFVLGNKIRNS